MKLPMRFRILQMICEGNIQTKIIDTYKIRNLINLEYAKERQCNNKNINTHILALTSVGLIEESNVYLQENQLISEYKATSEGFIRLNFIPK